MKKILLIGTHGQYNWGDDILLETFLTQLGRENRYFVNSYDPRRTEEAFSSKFDITCFHTTKDRSELIRYLFRCDLVFFAGGTIFRELHSVAGRNRYGSLLMILLLTLFARHIARKRIIMSNIGAGPLPTRFGRMLAGAALNTAMIVSFRDERSHDIARASGLRNGGKVVPDCVFVNEATYFSENVRKFGEAKDGLTIGVNLNHDISRPDLRDLYLRAIERGLKHLGESHRVRIVPVPMQIGFNPNDDIAELKRFIEHAGIRGDVRTPRSVRELGEMISGCDLLIGTRYHFIVISAILGRPVVPIVYDIKVASLAERLDLSPYAIEIDPWISEEAVVQKMESMLERGEMAGRALEMKSADYRKELKEYFAELKTLLAEPDI